jgi:hypothetical protein
VLAGRRGGLEPYDEELTRSLARLASASWGIKAALDRFPRLTVGLVRLPPVWRVVEAVMRGDLAGPHEATGSVRGPIHALRLLARRAGDPGRDFRLA